MAANGVVLGKSSKAQFLFRLKNLNRFFGGIILSLLGVTQGLSATSLRSVTVGNLSNEAEWIGQIQIESIREVDSKRVIDAEVVDVFKGLGHQGQSFSFPLPGGVDRRGMRIMVMGLPAFRVGSRYIVFLSAAPAFDSGRMLNLSSSSSLRQSHLVGWQAFKIIDRDGAKEVIQVGAEQVSARGSRTTQFSRRGSVRTYDDFVSLIYQELND